MLAYHGSEDGQNSANVAKKHHRWPFRRSLVVYVQIFSGAHVVEK